MLHSSQNPNPQSDNTSAIGLSRFYEPQKRTPKSSTKIHSSICHAQCKRIQAQLTLLCHLQRSPSMDDERKKPNELGLVQPLSYSMRTVPAVVVQNTASSRLLSTEVPLSHFSRTLTGLVQAAPYLSFCIQIQSGLSPAVSTLMEGPLSKWTNVVQGWQYRWFVLDLAMGVLSYYTSREKMIRGERRGCVKLKNAQMGINDEDDSTFTITVDSKVFHFQARNAEERQQWLDALQEARDLHTDNYALLQHTSRLLDSSVTVSEFDRRIIEADAYLQILIDQHQAIDQQLSHHEQVLGQSSESIKKRLQHLIELVKKTIVCLQFAKENPKTAMVNLCTNALADAPIRQLTGTTGAVGSSGLTYRPLGNTLVSPTPANDRISGEPCPQNQLLSSHHHHRSWSQSDKCVIEEVDGGIVITKSSTQPVSAVVPQSEAHHDKHHLNLRDVPAVSYSSSEEDDDVYYDLLESGSDETLNRDECNNKSNVEKNESECTNETQEKLSGHFGSLQVEPTPSSTNAVAESPGTLNNTLPPKYSRIFAYDGLYDDDDEKDLGSLQSEGSVISYLISQLRIGMDLTRITLPTFILEKRSTLEMYADFLAHPDLWIVIGDGPTPQARLIACLRWYLSAFHASRRTPVAKKPYNPILGEIFRCCYYIGPDSHSPSSDSSIQPQQAAFSLPNSGSSDVDIPSNFSNEEMARHGPIPYAADDCVVFLAEQVSHHPPISAFYAEYVPKRIQVSGHIYTKSKFLGLSIGVEMVGSATIALLDRPGEEYVVTFPSAYGRNILGVPWVELGGTCKINCAKTGYSAEVNFLTKPFYGGKKDQIRAKAFVPDSDKPFFTVEGEWNGQMYARWADSGKKELFVDTKALPTMKKQVRPRSNQLPNESRKMWESVTLNLKQGNIDAATDAKSLLEQRQRREAAARLEARQRWVPSYFSEFNRMDSSRFSIASSNTPVLGDQVQYNFKWPLMDRLFDSTEVFTDASRTSRDAKQQ
nr:oxysterol binding protein 9 [Hymenolepis microstoma]